MVKKGESGQRKPGSINSIVEQAVLRLGACGNCEVLAEVADKISAAQAATMGRAEVALLVIKRRSGKCPKRNKVYGVSDYVAIGKRRIVNNALIRLYHEGRVARIKKGVYAPPKPKLFKPRPAAPKAS